MQRILGRTFPASLKGITTRDSWPPRLRLASAVVWLLGNSLLCGHGQRRGIVHLSVKLQESSPESGRKTDHMDRL